MIVASLRTQPNDSKMHIENSGLSLSRALAHASDLAACGIALSWAPPSVNYI